MIGKYCMSARVYTNTIHINKHRTYMRPSIMANVSTKMVDIFVSCSINGIMSTVATYTKPPAINPCTSCLREHKYVCRKTDTWTQTQAETEIPTETETETRLRQRLCQRPACR